MTVRIGSVVRLSSLLNCDLVAVNTAESGDSYRLQGRRPDSGPTSSRLCFALLCFWRHDPAKGGEAT